MMVKQYSRFLQKKQAKKAVKKAVGRRVFKKQLTFSEQNAILTRRKSGKISRNAAKKEKSPLRPGSGSFSDNGKIWKDMKMNKDMNMNMKRNMKSVFFRIAFLLPALCVLLCAFVPPVSAEEDGAEPEEPASVSVFLTCSDAENALFLAREAVEVFDLDADGVFTADEALVCAHEALFEGGADGYDSDEAGIGLFWGKENEAGFALYRNHLPAGGIGVAVENFDLLEVFPVREDSLYCRFDEDAADVKEGETLTLTLLAFPAAAEEPEEDGENILREDSGAGIPVEGAALFVNGKETSFVTDEEGRVKLRFDGTGYCVVTAVSEAFTLIPPVCAVVVVGDRPDAGDPGVLPWALCALACLYFLTRFVRRRRRA